MKLTAVTISWDQDTWTQQSLYPVESTLFGYRKRMDKRSGRKKARAGDISFAAAPDSSAAE